MKFQKIVCVGIAEARLTPQNWARVDAFCEKRVSLPKESPQLFKELANADCVLIDPFGSYFTKEMIDAAPKLKYVGAISTAFGKIDAGHASQKGVTVTNVPGYATEAVAELTIGMIIANIREFERARKQAQAGDFSESTFFHTTEIKGKKYGVIGMGRIGQRVAELARAFGADVSYWSRNRKPDAEKKGATFSALGELASKCDFISLHISLNKQTENLLGDEFFQRLKPGAVLVNVAPNEPVNFSALVKRLAKGDVTYILDHSDELSPEQAKTLLSFPNCVLYPPIGYVTREATALKQQVFVQNIENFLKGTPANKVN